MTEKQLERFEVDEQNRNEFYFKDIEVTLSIPEVAVFAPEKISDDAVEDAVRQLVRDVGEQLIVQIDQ